MLNRIQCGAGQLIDIKDANYGRTSNITNFPAFSPYPAATTCAACATCVS